jgi:tetratricopeptide (TPR) repeat protein
VSGGKASFEQALNRGHSYIWDEKWKEAVAEFEKAARIAPHEPAPYDGLGTAYARLNQLENALANYKLAARYSRGNVMYLHQVADMQERLGKLREAGKTYMAIGEIELNRRRLNEAMDNWNRAIRLEPNLLKAHQRLASIYQRQRSVPNAIREYLAIARILNDQNEPDKALQACELALKLDPRNTEVHTAMELIRSGGNFGGRVTGPLSPNAISDVAQHMEAALKERSGEQTSSHGEAARPVQDARRRASEMLAEELFSGGELDAAALKRSTLISQALDYQTRGMINEAISAYEEARKAGVDNVAVNFNLGLLYQDKLRFEDAIREFEVAMQQRDFRLASFFSLGECHRARGRIEQAIEHFINVLKIVDLETVQHSQADRLIQLYENLADSLMTQGERDQAIGFANSLVDFFSHKGWEDKAKDARSRLNAISDSGMMILGDMLTAGSEQVLESLYLSQEYARRGMYDTAIEETYRAIQLAYDYMPAHIQLAEILGMQGHRETSAQKFVTIAETYKVRADVNGAINAYEQAVRLSPLDLTTRLRLIELLKRHGEIDTALQNYMAMGETYSQLAKIDSARETYQEALKLAPRAEKEADWRRQLLSAIAEIDMQRFDWRRALTAYRDLRRLDPEDERIALTLVDLYYKVGQPINAVGELDNYLKQLVRSGRGVKVVGILEDMQRQRPSDSNLVERLSRLYLQQRRKDEAIELLDKLGEQQLEAGENAAAIQTIERILALQPKNAASYQQLLSQLR